MFARAMTLVSEALLDAMVRYANTAQAVREYGVSCCTPRRAARLGQRSALGREIAPRLSAHLEQPGGPHATARCTSPISRSAPGVITTRELRVPLFWNTSCAKRPPDSGSLKASAASSLQSHEWLSACTWNKLS